MGSSLLIMVQSVELLLDTALDRAVRSQWQSLWDSGLPSLRRVRAESNRPHVTLFVARYIPAEVDSALAHALNASAVPIRLGGCLVFGSRNVTLARAVVPSRSLLMLHRRVWDIVSPGLDIPAHIEPGRWTPHVTLSRRMPSTDLGAAMTLLDPTERSGHGIVLRRWDGDAKREWNLTFPD